jgi:hypothetical protein
MTRRIFFTVAAAMLVLIAGSRSVQAQSLSLSDFKIPFDFVAHGKAFTAGQYSLGANMEGSVLTLEPLGVKGASAFLPVETRLGERKQVSEPELIFDKVNGKLYLSELFVPGEDGYLVLATKGSHTHESVKGSKKKS